MKPLKTILIDLFTVTGRMNRSRFAIYAILMFLIFMFSGLITLSLEEYGRATELTINAYYAIMFISFFSLSFLCVKRIHDLDWSAWWLLLFFFVPIALFVLGGILLFSKGTDGRNRFGDDPLKGA